MPGQTLQEVQFLDKYARQKGNGSRESWYEAIDRVMLYLYNLTFSDGRNGLDGSDYDKIHAAMVQKRAMPSMRALAMAGQAAERHSMTIYNCTYAPVIDLDVFREAVIILMNGAGFGYSVERKYIDRLPVVSLQNSTTGEPLYTVPDTTEGWADAISKGIGYWMAGYDVSFDTSQIRPEGTPLKTKGGIASGPQHLETALNRIRAVILNRQGLRLRPLDCHDILCHIADAVVSGGVRRSAMICLFDENDYEMLTCKSGDNLTGNEQRWNANNSIVIDGYKDRSWFSALMDNMHASGRGEPGLFSRYAINSMSGRDPGEWSIDDWGTNPCGEIVIKPFQMCNLSSAVCRADDTRQDIREKVEAAAIIGTIQSLANHFPGLRDEWSKNNEDDRLLGVDLMGIMDCEAVRDPAFLLELNEIARATNERIAARLGINKAAAITCVKPSGNSSVLLDASPGIHARWSGHYIRRVTFVEKNPIRKALAAAGVPMERKIGTNNQWVVSFPIKSPDGAIVTGDLTAWEQLNNWLLFKRYWTDHNPSCTITYYPEELTKIAWWLFDNQSMIGGLSFLPHFDAKYAQMPYEAIDAARYDDLVADFPLVVDLSNISGAVNVAATPACDGDICELPL